MTKAITVLGSTRPNFLILAPICVLLGLAVAVHQQGRVDALHAFLAFLGAILAHASVNLLNEVEDHENGLDAMTERTPFSGGSGTLQEHPELVGRAREGGILLIATVAAIGCYFVAEIGWRLLPIGLLGVLLVVSYSRWIVRAPLLCLLAPGLGFGPAMVLGTEFVLTGHYSWQGFVASLVPLFLVSGLLLLNQFPDREPDARVGRRHLVVLLERKRAAAIFVAMLLACFATLGVALTLGLLPPWAGLAFVALVPAAILAVNVPRHAESVPRLVPMLGLNVVTTLVTPTLLAIGLLLADSGS